MSKNYVKVSFESAEALQAWLDSCCIRCAMANREGRDRCDTCKANRQAKTAAKELNIELPEDEE